MAIELNRYNIGIDSNFRPEIGLSPKGKYCKFEDVEKILEKMSELLNNILDLPKGK